VLHSRRQHTNVSPSLRAANADTACDQLTLATVSQRNQNHVLAVAVQRQFSTAELAVFEPDAIPGSFAFAYNGGRLVQGIDTGEDLSRKGEKAQSATAFLRTFFAPLREKFFFIIHKLTHAPG
jgi:hypothetical protein